MKEKSILFLIFCGTSLRVLAVFTFYGIYSSRTAAADIFHGIIHVIIECTECSILEAIYVTTYKYTRNINCSYSKYLFKDSTCLPFDFFVFCGTYLEKYPAYQLSFNSVQCDSDCVHFNHIRMFLAIFLLRVWSNR